MHDLYDWITQDGEAAILQICQENRRESLTLEFKTKERADQVGLTRPDKKNLGRALSGFSNSVGGLLIWGVDARPDEDEIDCAQDLTPIASIGKFASDVSGLVTDYLMPPNEAIKVQDIPSVEVEGGGYLLVLVEPSELRPHMDMAPDDHRYYRRSGDRFVQMEHYEIQDMFNRIAPVQLDVFYQFEGIKRREQKASIKFGMRNNTRLTAKFPYIHLKSFVGGQLDRGGPYGGSKFGLYPAQTHYGHLFAGNANDVLHPGRELLVFGIDVPLKAGAEGIMYTDAHLQTLTLELQVGCENSQMREMRIDLSAEELRDLIDPHLP